MVIVATCMIVSTMLLLLFYLSGIKQTWDSQTAYVFECGYTSYFESRHSFSMQFYIVALLFLFLDMELCVMIPFMMSDFPSKQQMTAMFVMLTMLLVGLIYEWTEGKLEWKF